MTRFKKWVSNLSIKKKIIFYSYSVITPILLIICGFLMLSNYTDIQQTRHETNVKDIKGLSDGVNIILHDVADLSSYIAISVEVNQILKASNPEELSVNARLWSQKASMQTVEDMIALKGYIKGVAIYPENGVFPYLRCTDHSSFLPSMEDIRKIDTYSRAIEGRGKSNWCRIEYGGSECYGSSRNNKLVIYREIFDYTTKTPTPLAYLALGVQEEPINNLCDNILQDQGEGVLLFNRTSEELTRAGVIPQEVEKFFENSDYLESDLLRKESVVSVGGYDLFSFRASVDGMVVCKVVPKVSFSRMLGTIVYAPFILLLGILLGLLPVLMLVSNIVTRPLSKVCNAMDEFKGGDFEPYLKVETTDEVGQVAARFNSMVQDIKELIDKNYVMELKERESELATLQAQITPHFLYNTLDSLYWQAEEAGNSEIAENIYALSQLFRLVLGRGQKEVLVESEMELVTRYLEIQKMRFSKNVDFNVSLDESVRKILIPKLILQPFVENSVIHGVGDSKRKCFITVDARKLNERIRFTIKDTGIGMTQEQIVAVWAEKQSDKTESVRVGRYAIYNVKERLQLKYRDDFTLQINSKVNQGTEVVIEIPI